MILRSGLLSVVCGALCAGAARGGAEPENAKVTAEEIVASVAKLDARERAALANDRALLKQVVQLTHAQRLLLQEARGSRWDERPEVKAKVERARDTALAESWLQSVAAPPADYPGEDEIKAAYEAQRTSLSTPRQYRIAQIFITCPRNAAKTVTQKAEAKRTAVTKKLRSYKEDFAAIARTESDDSASAAQGGEIGWLTEAQIQPELRPLIVKLLKHEVTEPVRLNDGWHILKCLDKREAGAPSLEDVRPRLVTQLRAEKTKANSEAHVARLLKENPVTLDEEAIARQCAKQAENFKLNTSKPQPPGERTPGNTSD